MENLYISPDKTTPEVDFNSVTNILKISGESFPENSSGFYDPVFKWLREYTAGKPSFTFEFKMVYFNTSSSKAILDLITILEEYHNSGGNVKLIWHYEEDDDDIMESGQEFTEKLNLHCELIPYQD
ncbi:MAG: DUF1987 domain-containing protein [Candidatus Kapabacteria bacterium]|nr:DUF1987 domain-containing protein [Ignavibacteriota bacterium]MCW5884604.1 DUF1987 domain-containing protein [Candidatus Kapabacteria bacterium]